MILFFTISHFNVLSMLYLEMSFDRAWGLMVFASQICVNIIREIDVIERLLIEDFVYLRSSMVIILLLVYRYFGISIWILIQRDLHGSIYSHEIHTIFQLR